MGNMGKNGSEAVSGDSRHHAMVENSVAKWRRVLLNRYMSRI
jgi:hypothetical protein